MLNTSNFSKHRYLMDSIKQQLLELELSLHKYEVRSSREALDLLIADEFREIGVSGAYFGKQEILDRLPGEDAVKIEASDFEYRQISESIVQLIYKSRAFTSVDTFGRTSYRTSLWKFGKNKWQMIFHQGTAIV